MSEAGPSPEEQRVLEEALEKACDRFFAEYKPRDAREQEACCMAMGIGIATLLGWNRVAVERRAKWRAN